MGGENCCNKLLRHRFAATARNTYAAEVTKRAKRDSISLRERKEQPLKIPLDHSSHTVEASIIITYRMVRFLRPAFASESPLRNSGLRVAEQVWEEASG